MKSENIQHERTTTRIDSYLLTNQHTRVLVLSASVCLELASSAVTSNIECRNPLFYTDCVEKDKEGIFIN